MSQKKYISIIIVNFNGRALLEECLPSLFQIDYPSNSYEVIVVDNDSADDSVPYVKTHFPKVKLIESKQNLGFTGGNDLGFKYAKGEYIVLLNSDVVVDTQWLKELVKAAEPKEIGLVSSRLRYAIPMVELVITSLAVPRSQISLSIDHSPVGVLIEDVVCESEKLTKSVWYKDGFYDKTPGEVTTRRTNGCGKILLPFDTRQKDNTYKITLHGLETNETLQTPVELSIGGKVVFKALIKPYEVRQANLVLKESQIKKNFSWLIQNAGNIVLKNGYGKDRGSMLVIRKNETQESYEQEVPYFMESKELLAVCGASCLIKRPVIEQVGFFDQHYYMYYEDLELSLRAWRAGWKMKYAPDSLGYHRHRATTGSDETAFFLEHVEKNHLSFIITHFPWSVVIKEFTLFIARLVMSSVKSFAFQFQEDEVKAKAWKVKKIGREAAFKYVLKNFPRLVYSRIKMDQTWPMDYSRLERMVY